MSIEEIKKLLRELAGDEFKWIHYDTFEIDGELLFLELPKDLTLN